MEKIGVVSEVQVGGPGTRNIIYKSPDDSFTYITHLAISVLEGNSLKRIIPKYSNREGLFLGTLVEYDEETGSIKEIRPFNDLNEEGIDEIKKIYEKYCERLELLKASKRIDLKRFISDSSSLEDLKKALIDINFSQNEFDSEIFIKVILDNIRSYLIVNEWIKKGQRRVKLKTSNDKIINV